MKERIKLIRAMETIARAVNNEELFWDIWAIDGVADGDIDDTTADKEIEFYADDETFSELMATFLTLMKCAAEDGGLYCDTVTSKEE